MCSTDHTPGQHASTADNGVPHGENATLHEPISADGRPVLGARYVVPARHARAVRLSAQQTIRIINTHGTQVCDVWFFNGTDLSEYLSFEHTRPFINRLTPVVGDFMVTNRRRPIATLVADTSPGVHDALMSACDVYRYANLGVKGYHDNCSVNLRLALRAIGQQVREIPQPFNLWQNCPIQAANSFGWLPPASRAGD